LNEDPIGFEAGDGNLLRYVENRPTNAWDPSGLLMGRILKALPETGIRIIDETVEFANTPIYTPIPKWAEQRGLTSLPFRPRPDLWSGHPDDPHTTTWADEIDKV
jgi:hypothetical protein